MSDTMSPAERDLRTAALNSNTTIKILNDIRAHLDASSPRRTPSAFASPIDFLNSVRQMKTRQHEDPRLVNAISTFGGEGAPSDGGFALPDEYAAEVLLPVTGSGSLLGAFDPYPAKKALLRIGVDETAEWSSDGVTADTSDEGETITTSKPQLKGVNVVLHKVTTLTHLSEEFGEDSDAAGRWVWRALGRKVRDRVERLVLWGSGLNAPLGIMRSPALVTVAKESAQATATINATNAAKMAARLLPGSFPSAIWIAHSTALPQIMALGTIYNANGASPFGYGTLLGRPICVSEHAKPLGQLGDLAIVDPTGGFFYAVKGPRNAATIAFAFDQDLESYRTTLRLGCVPILSAPVARVTGSDTLSHVVTLEARP